MANVYLALENNLEIITCVNKIDLPNADAEKVMLEVESTIGLDTSNSIKCSAKTGTSSSLTTPCGLCTENPILIGWTAISNYLSSLSLSLLHTISKSSERNTLQDSG